MQKQENGSYCTYLDEAIFGSPVVMYNVNIDHLKVKKNNKGLISNLMTCADEKKSSNEILKHNIEKVHFYEQNPECSSLEKEFVSKYILMLFAIIINL